MLATRGVRVARETGALQLLPNALNYLAALNVHSGAFATAADLIDEVDSITQGTGLPPLKYAGIMLAAARGDEAPGLFEFGWADGDGARRGVGGWPALVVHRVAAQRARPLRPGARSRAAGLRARGRHGVRPGPGRTDQGRGLRRAAVGPPPHSTGCANAHRRAAPNGRLAWKRGAAGC